MTKLFFKGYLAEICIFSADEDEVERINEQDYGIEDIRDKLKNIYSFYNIITNEGIFQDENDIVLTLKHSSVHCSNIGEPLLNVDRFYGDSLMEDVSDSYGAEEFYSVYNVLNQNSQFDDKYITDQKIDNQMRSLFCIGDDVLIENVVSVITIEKGLVEISIPEKFDINKPITIVSHEIECKNIHVGQFLTQFNNGKLLMEPLEINLHSSVTKTNDIYYMSRIEIEEGRIVGDPEEA